MEKVISRDGTAIAFERSGKGPAVILVDGALCARTFGPARPLAALLEAQFTIFTYDRRGRGESGDTQPYAVEHEIEDIGALIEAADGSAYLYGVSSGAVLALRAAAKLGPARVLKLALCQAPLSFGDEAKQEFAEYNKHMADLLEANQPGEALAFFLADMMPAEMLEELRQSPEWPIMEALAPTLAYDNAVMGDGSLPVEAAQAATMPVLILEGGESPDFLHEAAEALAEAIPQAQRKTLEGQGHQVAPEALAPALVAFFAS